jgi:hypothetical protein
MGVINVHILTTNKCHCLWYKTYHYFVCEELDTIIIVLSFGIKKLLKGGGGGGGEGEREWKMKRPWGERALEIDV